MRYANVNGVRAEPQPKARGTCRSCGSAVIARCGPFMVWHWAHPPRSECDQWWESETEWHRAWKDRFPADWQEVTLSNQQTGERHIADVYTAHRVVVEFQRSSILPEEVAARESFYQRMVWVIDGTRSEMDVAHFGISRGQPDSDGMAAFRWSGRSKLFHRWHSLKPVFVDFGAGGFWRVCRFDPASKRGVVLLVSREAFAEALISGQTDFSSGGGPASEWR